MTTKIYVASSWRNDHQGFVVERLRAEGFEVYDFKNPAPGNTGFHWSEIDPDWRNWDAKRFKAALDHHIAKDGFNYDFNAMKAADVCVLLLPCGRSAHIEAGYFVGHPAKRLVILLGLDAEHVVPPQEPELMYRMADAVCVDLAGAVEAVHGFGRHGASSIGSIVNVRGWGDAYTVEDDEMERGQRYVLLREVGASGRLIGWVAEKHVTVPGASDVSPAPVEVDWFVLRRGWPGMYTVTEKAVENGMEVVRIVLSDWRSKPAPQEMLERPSWFFAMNETWVSPKDLVPGLPPRPQDGPERHGA